MAVVVIDPGHYGMYNPGVCEGYYEGNAMLTLALYLGEALMRKGADVRYTRTTNEDNPTLAQRGAMAEGADLFISLHSDASDNSDARGVTSFFSVQRPESEVFASALGLAVADVMGNTFRGSVARPSQNNPNVDYLGVLRSAVLTGVPYAFLIEHGFHSNMEDCMILSDNASLWQIAKAEAEVIAQYLNLGAQNPTCNIGYTIRPGESLYIIGQRFGIPWQYIAAANNISPPYTVAPGQQIIINLPPEWCAD